MKCENGRDFFYQWELNQRLIITEECSMVQFTNGTLTNALGVAVIEEDGVRYAEVPNILLQTAADLHAYAWDEENTCVTGHRVFPVEPMPKPAQYAYTQTEVKRYDLLLSVLEEKGAYYVPEVDGEGNLTWNKSIDSMPDVPGGNIRGPKGEQGPQGEPGIVNIDDTGIGAAAWSSRNIADRLCPSLSERGATVVCTPVEGYPLGVVSHIQPVQEGSGDPRPVKSIDVSTRGTTLRYGDGYGVITDSTDLTEGGRYKLTVNAKNAAGERVKLEAAEVYDANGSYSYTITGEIGYYDVTFVMQVDGENTAGSVHADIRLYFAEEIDESSLWQRNEGGEISLVEGAYVLSEYDPGNVRPITGTDSVRLWRGGKNLFDGYWESGYIGANTGANATDAKSIRTGYVPIVPGMTYYFSLCPNRNYYPFTYDADKNFMRYLGLKATSFSFKAGENERYLRIAQYNESQIYEEAQLELGSAATAYEPYRGDAFTAQLGQTVGVGTYDWNTGELTITKAIMRLTSDMAWKMTGTSNPNGIYSFYMSFETGEIRINGTRRVVSSHYPYYENGWSVSSVAYEYAIKELSTTEIRQIYLCDVRFKDMDSFKAFLDAENVQVLYTLTEPVTIRLAPQEILALSGENTLVSSTGDTEVTGRADPAAVIEKLTSAILALGGNV